MLLHRTQADIELCPVSSLASGYDIDEGKRFYFFVPCKRWTCDVCGPRKKNDLAKRIKAAKPQRFLTLTVKNPNATKDPNELLDGDTDPAGSPTTPRDAFDQTRRKVSELFRHFRKNGRPQEYVRILEQTKRGWPHYHFLMRGPKPWPVAEITAKWKQLTGSYIVDIQFVGKDAQSTTYVTKYLQKADSVTFTPRRVSASRNFFEKRDPQTPKRTLESWFYVKNDNLTQFLDTLTSSNTIQTTDKATIFTTTDREPGDELPPRLEALYERITTRNAEQMLDDDPLKTQ
jgi:hypothetical protein